jgi:glycosyltransferase involved in cell wall biosynthesis
LNNSTFNFRFFVLSDPRYYPPTIHAANILVEKGNKVHLVGFNCNYTFGVPINPKIKITFLGSQKKGVLAILQYCYSFVALILFQITNRAKYQIAYDCGAVGPIFLSSKLFNSKWIYHNHDLYENPKSWHKILKFIENRLCNKANHVCFPQLERGLIFTLDANLKKEPLILYNCPRKSYNTLKAKGETWHLANQFSKKFKYVMLYQGQFAISYRLDIYIKTLEYLPHDVGLIFIGRDLDFNITNEYNVLSKNLNVQDRFLHLNEIDYEELPQISKLSNLGLGKMSDNKDNSPINDYLLTTASNKLSEYLCLGLPIVVPNTKINIDFYENEGYAIIINTKNESQIANKIMSILLDELEYTKLKASKIYNYDYQFRKLTDLIG